jgi:CheY-specific phosphatase CheX
VDIENLSELVNLSARNVFTTMLGIQVMPVASIRDENPILQSEVTGVIALRDDLPGYLSIHMTYDQARQFTVHFLDLGSKEESAPQELRGVIGELLNMISGGLRSALSEEMYIQASLPLVTLSGNIVFQIDGAQGMITTLRSSGALTQVELTLVGSGT